MIFSETRTGLWSVASCLSLDRLTHRLLLGGGEGGSGTYMPHYVLLLNWTDQGIRNVRETIQRVEAADALEHKHGFRTEQIYWTVGPYDMVSIGEAPDDESATAFALELGSAGNVGTTTLRAYDREEMSTIIERLGPSPGA